MKISEKSLKFANRNQGRKPPPIPFYDEKSAVYNLPVPCYEVGTPEEWLQFVDAITQVVNGQDIQNGDAAYLLVKSLLRGDALQ
eukprot:3085049-Ditylum_brightwellii.AAC.1